MARTKARTAASGAASQALIATDSGIPSSVIRLRIFTPIIASFLCPSSDRERKRGHPPAPREILPGTPYLVTRRCTQRQFLLRPSRATNQVFTYCLVVASARFGILMHGYAVLSNHYHLVLTDVHGNLPLFMGWLNKHVAKAINARLGRWENLFDSGKYSAVALEDQGAVRDKLAYTLANPVDAGLVEKARQWPGCWSHPNRVDGAPITVERSGSR